MGNDAADPESVRVLRRDLAAIRDWSTAWQIPFHLEKCHILHVATANQAKNYSLLGSEMSSVTKDMDLGVITTADLKNSVQCLAAEQKAQKDPGQH